MGNQIIEGLPSKLRGLIGEDCSAIEGRIEGRIS